MNKIKHVCCLLLCLLCLLLSLPANAETVLKLNGIDMPDDFSDMHPQVKAADLEYHYYESTNEIITDFLLGSFQYDAFTLYNSSINYQTIMNKGYCLDLSSSEIISNAIHDLYPAYAEQCVYDGKIYAIPIHTQLNLTIFSTAVLEQTDFGEVKVPESFPEFLDFLEQWVDYLKENRDCSISVLGTYLGDKSEYNEQSYTSFLVDWLLNNYIMQKEYAGEELDFENEELVTLLNRCAQVGADLYDHDPATEATGSIVNAGTAVAFLNDESKHFLSLRLNSEQPKLISVYLTLQAVNAKTEYPELCIELMESLLQNNLAQNSAYLYQSAEPVPDPDYDAKVAQQQSFVQESENQLSRDDLSEDERDKYEYNLERQQIVLKSLLENENKKYIVSPLMLATYRTYTDYLYVPMPGTFTKGEDAKNFRQLKARFVGGQMTAEQLTQELTRIARMIEAEQGE